jgi:hypothetical protein
VGGETVVTVVDRSGHEIQRAEPALVISAVRRVVSNRSQALSLTTSFVFSLLIASSLEVDSAEPNFIRRMLHCC